MEKELSFEEAMEKLEGIIALLEDGELALDESLKIFEEGITLYQTLAKQLEKAEGKVKLIMVDKDGEREKFNFEPGEEQGFEF